VTSSEKSGAETHRSDSGPAHAPSVGRRWLHRLIEPVYTFPAIGLVVLVVIWLGALNLSRVGYENARQTAMATSQELLKTYEAQVVRVLREIDQTLKSLQYAYSLRGEPQATLDDLRDRDLLPPDLVFTVSLTDDFGRIVASTGEVPDSGMIDRSILDEVRGSDILVELSPVQSGSESRLRFSRPLSAPDGAFNGVAVVEVDAAFFVSGYDPTKLGEDGVLAVLGNEGIFRVRRSGERVYFGETVDYASVVTTDDFSETGVVLSISDWDYVVRYTSARELYDFPLALVVGLSEEEQLASAHDQAISYQIRAVGASALLLLGLALVGRMSWRVGKLRENERESRIAHARRVEHLAYHDALTGLPNRSFLSKILDDRIRQSGRYGREFALLFLDLDGFKQINDSLGHGAGDDLLREVARRLTRSLRETDTVARMGGDEFMVVLPEVESEERVSTVARKILTALSEPFVLFGEKFSITVSVGISIFPLDGEDQETLMKNADIAMYAAKDDGKNNFRYFSTAMSNASEERIKLETSLRRALANEEFELHYQTRRDLESGRVTGMEALLRWNHPEFGTLGPNRFLPLAEETGLILPIGKWVLRTACRQSQVWRKQGLPRLSVAVNLSARQFFDVNLSSDIRSTLEETGMAPELLEMEVSESVLARDTAKTLPVLERLKKIGVRITVDNFGTGYSALASLGRLPLDTIKIDRLFVRQDASDAASRDVINGILAMGRVLSPSVIAHGVETKEQVDFLRDQVCDQVQGFFFGKPFRAAEVFEMLQSEEAQLAGAVTIGVRSVESEASDESDVREFPLAVCSTSGDGGGGSA